MLNLPKLLPPPPNQLLLPPMSLPLPPPLTPTLMPTPTLSHQTPGGTSVEESESLPLSPVSSTSETLETRTRLRVVNQMFTLDSLMRRSETEKPQQLTSAMYLKCHI